MENHFRALAFAVPLVAKPCDVKRFSNSFIFVHEFCVLRRQESINLLPALLLLRVLTWILHEGNGLSG